MLVIWRSLWLNFFYLIFLVFVHRFPISVEKCTFLYLIRHGLKKDGRRRDFLLIGHETMRQVTAVRKVQSHDPAVGLHDGRVDSKVSRGTLQRSTNANGESAMNQREDGGVLGKGQLRHCRCIHVWYPSMAARWLPISQNPDRKLPEPSSDRVSPAHQHALYHRNTWKHGSY